MTLDNGQYFDLIENYDLVADYLQNYLWFAEETFSFAFDTYGLNEETFENLYEWQGQTYQEFEDYLRDNWEEYEEETEEENEEETENMNEWDQIEGD